MILTFLGLVFLRLGVTNSYVWVLVLLRLGDSFPTFRSYYFLRLRVSFLTFGGWFYYVWGLVIDYVRGLVLLRLEVSDSYVWGLLIHMFRG